MICPPGIALILQPMWSSVAVATVAGIAVTALVRLSQRAPRFTAVLPVVAAFVVACIVFRRPPRPRRGALRTLLAPGRPPAGRLLVTAMAELVTGHMVAGTSRLGYGLVQVLLFTPRDPGRRGSSPRQRRPRQRPDQRHRLVCRAPRPRPRPLAIALLESPPPRLVPWIFVVLVPPSVPKWLVRRSVARWAAPPRRPVAIPVQAPWSRSSPPRTSGRLPSVLLAPRPRKPGRARRDPGGGRPTADADVPGVVGIVAAIALGCSSVRRSPKAWAGSRAVGRLPGALATEGPPVSVRPAAEAFGRPPRLGRASGHRGSLAVRSQGFSARGSADRQHGEHPRLDLRRGLRIQSRTQRVENRGEEEADAHGIRDVGDLRISQPEPTQPIDVLLPDRRRVTRGGRREPEDRSINHVQG